MTVDFTLLEPTESLTTESECDAYFWNGQEYTESGTYEWLGVNEAGYDSVAVLDDSAIVGKVDEPLSSCRRLSGAA